MNVKRFVPACLVVFVFIVGFDWVFHGHLLQDAYMKTANMWRGKEPEHGDASSVDLPVPGRPKHRDRLLCRVPFVWHLRLWGRDGSRDAALQQAMGEMG